MRRRHAFTAVEAVLAFALGAGLLGMAFEVQHMLSMRALESSDRAQAARSLGVLVTRVRRCLRFSAAVRPAEGGFDAFTLVRRDGSWQIEEVRLRLADGGVLFGPPDALRPVDVAAREVGVRDDGGRVVVELGLEDGPLEVGVTPVVPSRGPRVAAPGEDIDLDALREATLDVTWLAGFTLDPGGAPPSGSGLAAPPDPVQEGRIDGPTAATRSSLYTEASVLGAELRADGRALFPPPGEGGKVRPDTYTLAQGFMQDGMHPDRAALLAASMAALGGEDRFVRAAALGLLESLTPELDPHSRAEWIGALAPELIRGAGAGGDDVGPGQLAGTLLTGRAGVADPLFRPDAPGGFSTPGAGDGDREATWDDWETILAGTPGVDELLTGRPGASGPGAGGPGAGGPGPGGPGAPGGPSSTGDEDAGSDAPVAVPVEVFPPPEDPDATGAVPTAPRTPDAIDAAAAVDAAAVVVDTRATQVAAQEANRDQRQAELDAAVATRNGYARRLQRAEDKLAQREARLEGFNADQADGHCPCPETRALIEQSKQEIQELEDDLAAAKREVAAATARRDVAQAGLNEANARLDEANADLSRAQQAAGRLGG